MFELLESVSHEISPRHRHKRVIIELMISIHLPPLLSLVITLFGVNPGS